MLRRTATDAVGYWLQLILSMGIATLGLAMGSTAVVIGAMLISPLMQPLIELGIGLATGSLLLSIRAGVRTATSIVVVVLGAAAVTWMLPFHEVTAELAARTSPTMIDLFIAVGCALAAVYTTVRQGKDAIATAAGTAIGISLVPPLCTAGYGLGTWSAEMFQGALLLFTANFAAIITVTAVTVLMLGFGQVQVGTLEDEVLAGPGDRRLTHRAARISRRAARDRPSVLVRLLIPMVLLGAIIIPLKRALEEVSWQVRVRAQVEGMLASVPGAIVRQSLEVRGGIVRVRLFLVGTEADARQVATELRTKIAAVSGSEPFVEVIAVPDAATLDVMATQLRAATMPPVAAPTPPPRDPPATTFLTTLHGAIARHWPTTAGELLRLRSTSREAAPLSLDLEVTHLGTPLGAPGEQLLEQAWSAELELAIDVIDRAIPTAAIEAVADQGAPWLASAARLLDVIADVDGLAACITAPAAPVASPRGRRAPVSEPAPSIAVVRATLDSLVSGRVDVELTTGPGWRIQIVRPPCPAPPGPR